MNVYICIALFNQIHKACPWYLLCRHLFLFAPKLPTFTLRHLYIRS